MGSSVSSATPARVPADPLAGYARLTQVQGALPGWTFFSPILVGTKMINSFKNKTCSVVVERLLDSDASQVSSRAPSLLGAPAMRNAPPRDFDSESGMSSDSSNRNKSRTRQRGLRPAEKRQWASDGGSTAESGSRATTKKHKRRPAAPAWSLGEEKAVEEAKSAYEAALNEELIAEAEMMEADEAALRRAKEAYPYVKPAPKEAPPATCSEALTRVAKRLQHVSRTSRHLKGTYVRDINESVSELLALAQEPASAELARVEAENRDLRQKVTALEAALTAHGKMVEELMAAVGSQQQPAAEPTSRTTEAEAVKALLEVHMAKVDAKLEAIAMRLPPEPILRPPLAADRARAKAAPQSQPVVAGTPATSWPALGAGKRKAAPGATGRPAAATRPIAAKTAPPPAPAREPRGRSRGNRKRASPRSQTPHPPPQPATSTETPWTVVAKRGKKKSRAAQQPPQTPRRAAPQLRLPRKAAVTLTVTPEALKRGVTYAEVLREVQKKVDLASLGITAGLKSRRIATGAFLFEVPGPESEARADSLIAKLREVLRGSEEDVRVSRPVKSAELRVSGLDASATPEAVAAAVARLGECSPDDVKVGEIRDERSGLGAVWLRCPAKAAEKVVKAGRVLVGWVAAAVRLLEARPLRCYRCLHKGHVRVQCTGECDRSGLCYRCGKPGHKARECSADPHCTICAEAGKPADHRVGGKACAASSVPPRTQRGVGAGAVARPPPSRPEMMEIAQS